MVESVVDYKAWEKGYMPPSEHVLIDQLAYRGARVIQSSDWGEAGAVWVVVRGNTPNAAVRKAMRELLAMAFPFEDETPSLIVAEASEPR